MIKDISDVVSSKGWKYTGGVALIAIGMAGLYHLIKKGANIGECYANTKISTASKTTLLDKKGRIDRDRDAERHRQRMEVESLKARSKKEIL